MEDESNSAIPLVLNQYRVASSYKDEVGRRYHFPNRYLSRLQQVPAPFVYYEPREGGEQVYFGTGVVRAINEDTEDDDHSYAEIDDYRAFPSPLSYFEGPEGKSWEEAKTMRNSVRAIPAELFDQLLAAAGLHPAPPGTARPELYEARLAGEWQQVKDKADAPALRKKRRILEAYERPSRITNEVKRKRGDACALCGRRGFLKRNRTRYCEVHHVFHLAAEPPPECLGPDFLVVLCANCHRRMHYADVGSPMRVEGGWRIVVDNEPVTLLISNQV